MRNWGGAALLLPALCLSQVYPPGAQVLTFLSDVDDSDQPYALYLPRSFDPAKKYPLVISLHAATSNHRLNLRRVFGMGNRIGETDLESSRYFPRFRDVDFIVASPSARGNMGYQGIPEKDVYDVLADVKRRFPIDDDRIYLTGSDTGGGGTLWLGLTRPDVWAAIAPVCPAVPEGVEHLAPNALDLPVHLFHGDIDPLIPAGVSREWQKRLLDLGAKAEYVEYPGARHNAWDYAYRNGQIFDWFAKYRRDRYPDRVRFVSRAYKYDTAYWVQFDSLTPGTLASIDARFTAPNKIEIATEQLEGFTLKLAGHPRFSRAAPLSLSIDGATLRAKGDTVSFVRSEKGWKAGHAVLDGGKRSGAEGPIREAVAARHIYVYGTADLPGPEELKQRRDMATFAAEWSQPRAHLLLSFLVKADREVNASDLATSNLVLFGTRETNSLIARFAPQFPLALNAGAADYGLTFVVPVGNHYVVVNSGLPWWTGADQTRHAVSRFPLAPFRVLQTFGDYMLFRGSLESVVAEGLFDRRWKLPPEAAASMKETGAVVIQ